MTDLSPAAQAVLDASLLMDSALSRSMVAATLRAAADCLTDATSAHTLYAIATELEAQ